jgi:hypothetical protein
MYSVYEILYILFYQSILFSQYSMNNLEQTMGSGKIYIYNKNMNEYYYYVILCRYIDRRDRVICTRRDRHLITHRIPRRNALMASIYVHMGSPCYRYCICRYFSDDDLIDAHERLSNPAPWSGYYPM